MLPEKSVATRKGSLINRSQASLQEDEIHFPVDNSGGTGCINDGASVKQGPKPTLAHTDSALECTSRASLERLSLGVSRGSDDAESARLPVDRGLASGSAAEEQQMVRSSASFQGLLPTTQDATPTNPPQSSKSFFSFFLSAFQGSSAAGSDAADEAPDAAVPTGDDCQNAHPRESRSSPNTVAPVASVASQGAATGPVKARLQTIPMPHINGLGHPLPRRFRKTRGTGTRRRSRHRETKASLARGAERFLGLFRRVGVVGEGASGDESKQASNASNGDSSDAPREGAVNHCESSSPSTTVDRTLMISSQQPVASHEDDLSTGSPRSVPGRGEPSIGRRTDDGEYGVGQSRALHITSEGTLLVHGELQRGRSQSTHFHDMLESPTTLAVVLPPGEDEWPSESGSKWGSTANATADSQHFAAPASDSPAPTLTSVASQHSAPLASQSCDMAVPDGWALKSNPSGSMKIGGHSRSSRCDEARPGDSGSHRDREEVNDGACQDAQNELSRPPDPQTTGMSENDRSWLPGPHLYRKILDGINQLVEVSGIRRTAIAGSAREPIPGDLHSRSDESPADEAESGDPQRMDVERSDWSQSLCENTGPGLQAQDSPEGQEHQSAPQSIWPWNFLYKKQGVSSNSEARDPSIVAASYLSDSGSHTEAHLKGQPLLGTTVSEMYAPVGNTPRASSRREVCLPVEESCQAGVAEPPLRTFEDHLVPGPLGTVHPAARSSFDEASGSYSPSCNSFSGVRRVDRVRFTTLAEDLERGGRLQVPLEHKPPDQDRAHVVPHFLHPTSLNDPATVYLLPVHQRDSVPQQPLLIGNGTTQWILPNRYRPGFPGSIGFNHRGLAVGIPNATAFPASWEDPQRASFPLRWQDEAVRTVPTHVVAFPPHDAHEVTFGPIPHQNPAPH